MKDRMAYHLDISIYVLVHSMLNVDVGTLWHWHGALQSSRQSLSEYEKIQVCAKPDVPNVENEKIKSKNEEKKNRKRHFYIINFIMPCTKRYGRGTNMLDVLVRV